jgi:TPR repeat protein
VKWLRHQPYFLTPATISDMERLSSEFGADELLATCRAFRDDARNGSTVLLSRISALEERQRSLELSCDSEAKRFNWQAPDAGTPNQAVAQPPNQIADLLRRVEQLEDLTETLKKRICAEQHYRRGAEYFYGTNGYGHRGIDLSRRLGLQHIKKAAELGHADAQYVYGRILRDGPGEGYGEPEDSTDYMKLSADQDNSYGQMGYGRALHFGYGITQNPEQAFFYYEQAASHDNGRGQNGCGYCYEKGFGVAMDLSRAVEYYRQGAEQANAGALHNYGCCLRAGTGVASDVPKGCTYIKQAAEQGDPNAMHNFAWCLEYGKGVARNLTAATKWYKLAANAGHEKAKADFQRVSALLRA